METSLPQCRTRIPKLSQSERLLDLHALFEYVDNVFHIRHIFEGIAIHHDDVGIFVRNDSSELIKFPQSHCRPPRPGADRLQRRHPVLDKQDQFIPGGISLPIEWSPAVGAKKDVIGYAADELLPCVWHSLNALMYVCKVVLQP